jgi:hypothetical protein
MAKKGYRKNNMPALNNDQAEPFFGKTKEPAAKKNSQPFFQAKPEEGTSTDETEQKADAVADNSTGGAPSASPDAAAPAAPGAPGVPEQADAPVPGQAQPLAAARFIVDDNAVPAVGQARKTDFLDKLKTEIGSAVDEAFAGTAYTAISGPYISASMAHYQLSTPAQLEQMMLQYEPGTAQATTADSMIGMVKQKAAADAKDWKEKGGDSSGDTEEKPGTLSTIGSLIGGLFKKAEGGASSSATSPSPVPVMQQLGKGTSLDQHSQSKLAPALGSGLGNVQVHTDTSAARLSDNMDARAFTVGNHIAFASGEYNPGTVEGDALMAHELAHVQQQSGAGANGKVVTGETTTQSLEDDADNAAASSVMNTYGNDPGALARLKKGLGRMKTGLSVQRCKKKPEPAPTPTPKTDEEILAYVTEINVPAVKIRGGADGLQLARETIGKWRTGDPAAMLTLNSKLNLIRELSAAGPSEADQVLILDLIQFSEVYHAKAITDNKEVEALVPKFSDANKKRYEALKKGRASEKDTSGESFNSDYIKQMINDAHANALLTPHTSGRFECIDTVRHISVSDLYKHLSADEQMKIKDAIDKECAGQNRMVDAMSGLGKAGYVEGKSTVEFNKRATPVSLKLNFGATAITYSPSYYPDTLKSSVWAIIDAATKDKEGWHAFGLGIMDNFHSVTLLVNIRPGGPFVYFVDQNDRSAIKDTYRLPSTIAGTQHFSPAQLDPYLEMYAHVNYEGYLQRAIDRKETASGTAVTEAGIAKLQPRSQMDLWEMRTTKK